MNTSTLPEQGFDFSILLGRVFLYALGFVLLVISPYCVAACFVLLSVYSLFGRRQALEAMAVSVIVKYANPGLVAFPSAFGLYAWAFLFIASFSLLIRSRIKNNTLIIPLSMFYITVICISFWSKYPAISMLKATSFYIVVLAIISGSLSMDENEFDELSKRIFSIFFTIFILSIPFYFFPNIGFMRNGRGFQGILNHPQSFGILWAPLSVWLIFRVFFVKNAKYMKEYVLFLVCLIACMFLSKSRTSVVATALAFFLSLPVFLSSQAKKFGGSMKKGVTLSLLTLMALLVLLGTSETFSDAVSGFVTKGQSGVTVGEAFQHSRGRGVESHWGNFLKSPWVGNGFGVDASADFGSRVKYLMGIPISASSEKGIVYTAILEEIGVIGLAAFLFFLSAFFLKAIRLEPPLMAMLVGCLTVNVGEAVLFSVNGNGLMYWILIGLCLASSTRRLAVSHHAVVV